MGVQRVIHAWRGSTVSTKVDRYQSEIGAAPRWGPPPRHPTECTLLLLLLLLLRLLRVQGAALPTNPNPQNIRLIISTTTQV